MKYLITGGAGFIGSSVAKKLIASGNEVTIIDNLSTGYKLNLPNQAHFIFGDISKKETIKKITPFSFDAILHLAGQSSGEISFEDPINDLNANTISTLLLLNYACQTGCKKIIFASSMAVYGEQQGKEQYIETDKVYPKSFYAVSKLASEKYIKIFQENFGINYTILRYSNIYGPQQNFNNLKQGMVSIYLAQFLDNSLKSVVVKGSNKRFRDQCYIEDAVNITIQSIHDNRFNNEVINVGTGKKTLVEKVILTMQKILSSKKKIVYEASTPGDQNGIYANANKIKSLISFEFTDFEKGLEKMINWAIQEKKDL